MLGTVGTFFGPQNHTCATLAVCWGSPPPMKLPVRDWGTRVSPSSFLFLCLIMGLNFRGQTGISASWAAARPREGASASHKVSCAIEFCLPCFPLGPWLGSCTCVIGSADVWSPLALALALPQICSWKSLGPALPSKPPCRWPLDSVDTLQGALHMFKGTLPLRGGCCCQ